MRPIERGPAPRTYTNYSDAQLDLIDVLGDYCSYCERQIETHLAVEHVQPKSRKKALRNEWNNFLLGCVNCNSCKGKKSVVLANFIWPDQDNTARGFRYTQSGEVRVASRLRGANKTRAQATLELVGLDRVPGHPITRKRPTRKDLRWLKRQEVFELAERQRGDLAVQDTQIVRQLIVDAAVARGMFSIWMQVFADDRDMRDRFIQAFRGTSAACFAGPSLKACKRTGGAL